MTIPGGLETAADLSVFDVFKIGIGPSSSHTMGPMTAARRFVDRLAGLHRLEAVARIRVRLLGSLAHTGRGHCSDDAIILGLSGERPETLDPDQSRQLVETVRRDGRIRLSGRVAVPFDTGSDIVFDTETPAVHHQNELHFSAFDREDGVLWEAVYCSVGGGFVTEVGAKAEGSEAAADRAGLPYPFSNTSELLAVAGREGVSIADVVRANELARRSETELVDGLSAIQRVMRNAVERGMRSQGELPGALHVTRRAPRLRERLEQAAREGKCLPTHAVDWAAASALAVSEENAAGGKIVTAPTNGAAGVIPGVIEYYMRFCGGSAHPGVDDLLLTAAAVGAIIKSNASISGAEVGCQGEVGSAAAMASAGLAAALGGSPEQVENAAEIALEHHLGITCDPVAGLVQVPCIERNGMGAVKAISAASLALAGNGTHIVTLDQVIQTMRDTGYDMMVKYKETSIGGLAVNVVTC